MKKKLFLMVAAFMAMQSQAAPVDHATALRTARNFLSNEINSGRIMSNATDTPVLFKAEMGSSKVGQPVYYIFNTSTTFVVVSGDDRANEILMVGDAPLDANVAMPDGLTYMLNYYKKQIEYLQERPGLVVEKTSVAQATPSLKAVTYGPLLTCNWDQSAPYYNQCVFTYNNRSYQCVTGCPATSAAMVMYYWKYPTTATATVPAYTMTLNDYYRVSVSALPSTTFDWANMKDSYRVGYTTAQANAVATLMRYVGQAEKMRYGTDGSGIYTTESQNIVTMYTLFGYDSNTCRVIRKSAYSEANWGLIMQSEVANGRPIVYMGVDASSGGHAFNLDGYRDSDGKYHINFGWSGYGNSWCAMNAFSYAGDTFSQDQQAIVGIQPPGGEITYPILTLDTDTIDFGTIETGETLTRTFHVTGINLLTDVTFSRTGNASYTVEPETLTAAQVTAGADITVTYKPTTAGTHSGAISVKSPGAVDKKVVLTGTATPAPTIPTVSVNPTDLEMTAAVGESVTATCDLQGYNLLGAIMIKANGTGFSVDKSSVTKTAAGNGVTLTVTYKPTTLGTHSGNLMVHFKKDDNSRDTIYVQLTGTATFTSYAPVMLPANESYITPTSFRAEWTDQTMASAIESYTLAWGEAQTNNYVENITDHFYTLDNMTAGVTYRFRVIAHYKDGSNSEWSNTEVVTLPEAPAFQMGDVNHDGAVNIKDVTDLIDYLLGSGTNVYEDTADVRTDGTISIADVTALIDMLLGNS